jgi:hypothetical protein
MDDWHFSYITKLKKKTPGVRTVKEKKEYVG